MVLAGLVYTVQARITATFTVQVIITPVDGVMDSLSQNQHDVRVECDLEQGLESNLTFGKTF